MQVLPNKEISKQQLATYCMQYSNLFGEEGKIFKGEQENEVRKIFRYPLLEREEELNKFHKKMDNKLKKLILLHKKQISNDIFPIATISYNGCLVGYKMTSPNLKKVYSCNIDQLKQLKEKLTRFHSQGIIHGDIKCSNLLLNNNNEIVLSDLDNMQVDDNPIDSINYIIEFFLEDDKLVDESADIYLYNLFLLQQLAFPNAQYDEINDKLVFGHFPDIFTEQGREELFKMQQCFVKYEGNYLIDSIRNEGKVYGKTTKSNSPVRPNI